MQKFKHILWLPTGGQIGDGVMILSVFREVLAHNPGASITYLVRRNASILRDLGLEYPQVEVVPLKKGLGGIWGMSLQIMRMFARRQVVVIPPHPGIHPQGLLWFAWLLRLRGNYVVGMRYLKTWYPCTKIVEYRTDKPYYENIRYAFNAIGIKTDVSGSPPRLQLCASLPKDFTFAPHSYIVVHPFAIMPRKTLPMRRWRDILTQLITTYPNYSFVITGAKENAQAAKEISEGMPKVKFAINLSILEIAGILQNSALYISVDTGITHIAGVLQIPSVIVAHLNDPAWLPWYNPNAILLSEKAHCLCGQPGKVCEVIEDGVSYRRCAYDVADKAIMEAVATVLGR